MATRQHRTNFILVLLAFVTVTLGVACDGAPPPAKERKAAVTTAPDSYRVAFETSRGRIVFQIDRAWAPMGADRFYQARRRRLLRRRPGSSAWCRASSRNGRIERQAEAQ